MPHDENFFGDRLRLTSFLRIVGHVPRQSVRRRHTQNVPEDDRTKEKAIPSVTAEAPSVFPASPLNHRHGLGLLARGSSAYQASSTNASGAAPSSPCDGLPSTVDDLDRRSYPRNTAQANEMQLKTPHPRKEPLVYRAKAKRAAFPPIESSNTRKRRLPVNELALVRTTTADGLPTRSMEDDIPVPFTSVDPIEDSQMINDHHVPKPNSKSSRVRKPQPSNVHRPAILTKSPWKMNRKLKSPPKALNARTTLRATTSDGFTTAELIHFPKPKQNSVKVPKKLATAKTSTPKCLALADGYLPVPFALQQVPHSQISGSASRGLPSQQLRVFTLTNMNGGQRTPPSLNAGFIQTTTQRQTENEITTQLSRITAPARQEDSDSETDADVNEGGDSSEAETTGTGTSTRSSNSDDNRLDSITPERSSHSYESPPSDMAASFQPGDGEYYHNAIHHSGRLFGDNDAFWSQYNAIE